MKHNKNFEFDIRDIDTIEMALRKKVAELSQKLMDGKGDTEDLRIEIKETSGLLARIHHQKNFYRPKEDVYVSG
tara:strand:+ start:119 stop:340 length:222 start_codon:yes stop_codon:yes gene_type:complete